MDFLGQKEVLRFGGRRAPMGALEPMSQAPVLRDAASASAGAMGFGGLERADVMPHPATAPQSEMRRNRSLVPLGASGCPVGLGGNALPAGMPSPAHPSPFSKQEPLGSVVAPRKSKFASAQRDALGGGNMKASLEQTGAFPGAAAVPKLATGAVALRRPVMDDSGALVQLSSRVREAGNKREVAKGGKRSKRKSRRNEVGPSVASAASTTSSGCSYEGLTSKEIVERERQRRLEKQWHPLSQKKRDSYGPRAQAGEEDVQIGSPSRDRGLDASMRTGVSGASSQIARMRDENAALHQQNTALLRMSEENERLKKENERFKQEQMKELARKQKELQSAENRAPFATSAGFAQRGLPPMQGGKQSAASRPRLGPLHSNQVMTHCNNIF